MKLFFVVGSFKLGGTERTASRVGLELIRRGHSVTFVLINGIFDYNEPELIKNSIVLTGSNKSKFVRIVQAVIKLIKLLREQKPDYLISFSLGINLFIFFTFYKRMIFRVESNFFVYRKKTYRRYIQKLISLFPNVKKIVIPSKGLYEKCKEYFYVPDKVILISNPLNVDEVKKLSEQPIDDYPFLREGKFIVTAGRLKASKGFLQLIEVYAQSKLIDDFELVILGEGPQQKELKDLIFRNNLQKKVFLLGYQSNPYRFFSRSRFFVLNSWHESFGNVLIESIACDTPVVSNDCDFGPRHIIENNVNGLLYDRHDQAGFIHAMEKVAYDEIYYRALKKGAVISKDKYHSAGIADIWVNSVLV